MNYNTDISIMPEGPEVTITSQYLNKKLSGNVLKNIKIIAGRYTHQKLKGWDLVKNSQLKFVEARVKGKFMYVKFIRIHKNKGGNKEKEIVYMMNSYGMTGRWTFEKTSNTRISFDIKGKKRKLYFNDQRNFGTVVFTEDESVLQEKLNKLAVDLLKSGFTQKQMEDHIHEFIKKKSKSKGNKNIVAMLMTQDRGLGSGIGNYLCAEILYDAKISPHRDITSLNKKEIKSLAKSIRTIMKKAYVNNTTPYLDHVFLFVEKHYKYIKKGTFPDPYPDIKLRNKEFEFKVYQQETDPKGNPVSTDIIFQKRTTWWVKKVQK